MKSTIMETFNRVETFLRESMATDPVIAGLVAIAVVGFSSWFIYRRIRAPLLIFWDRINSSFWFLPTVMMIAAIILAVGMVELDTLVQESQGIKKVAWIWTGGSQGARTLLGVIASSMITIAGVVFSINMVVLALVSNQFGPRLIRNFRQDKGNQIVLGTFIATFVYCLLVLRKVTDANGSEFVPHLAIAASIILALANVGVIIYFIHHVAVMTQVTYVISLVSADLQNSIVNIFPEKMGEGKLENQTPTDLDLEDFDCAAFPVEARESGYLQLIDSEGMMNLTVEKGLVVHSHYRPGDFVFAGTALVSIQPKKSEQEELAKRVRALFVIGQERTPLQDVEFCIHQLVEIAIRALSPGINDPHTAVSCIDHLSAGLCQIAGRKVPSRFRFDENNKLRVIADAVSFEGVVDAAFNQIRQYGQSSVAVSVRLLETLTIIAKSLVRNEDREPLRRQAVNLIRGIDSYAPMDREAVEQRYHKLIQAIAERNIRTPADNN
jgi:uncharacterized membrane protein